MPYRVEHIDPSKTAMIVVDMQNDFVADGAKLRSAQAAAMVAQVGLVPTESGSFIRYFRLPSRASRIPK
jgi:hypothetical protein